MNDKSNPTRKYFIIVPNMIDNFNDKDENDDFGPFDFRLYVHIKRVAGEDGICFQSTRTLAKKCNMSIGEIHNSKKILVAKKLITIEESGEKKFGKRNHHIRIVDVWQKNIRKYERSSEVKNDSPGKLYPSYSERSSSSHEIKKNLYKKVNSTS